VGFYKTLNQKEHIMAEPITMKINEVEYVRKDSIPSLSYDQKEGPWEIGKPYLIRTVTMIQHGILVDVTDKELVLSQAAWIADTGRFSDFVNGKIEPDEVEPFPQDKIVIVGRGALVDAVLLIGTFTKQK
jgi:hypothetical protein